MKKQNEMSEKIQEKVTSRLEAFSDGVLAIIITIMVLELKAPHGTDWSSLKPVVSGLISYVMSFLFVGVYWGNHHHLIRLIKRLSGSIMLANLNLLFWLSLVPVATGWMGQNNFAPLTVATYAVLLNICGLAYLILQKTIEACHKEDVELKLTMKRHTRKAIFSLISYASAIPFAYLNPYISIAIFFGIAIFWLVPDKELLEKDS